MPSLHIYSMKNKSTTHNCWLGLNSHMCRRSNTFSPHLYGLGYPRQPSPELPWPRQRLAYFFPKFNQPFTLGTWTRLGGGRKLGWASCLTSAGRVTLVNKSSNIGKTTTTNQCRRVPDLWRPRSVKIKRYYTKNGRLIPTAKRGKEIKQLWN